MQVPGVDYSIASSDKDATVETNGIPMKYDMSGDMTSNIKVDKNSGWIIEATIIQDIKGDITMEGNDQMPEGLKISMTMKSDVTYTDK